MLAAGADGVTAHLREDRRHITDADLVRLGGMTRRLGAPLNLEIAATEEMVRIAIDARPHATCLVPERREERTTEGGLDVVGLRAGLEPMIRRLRGEGGSRVSLFVEAAESQVRAAAEVGELHTGAYCFAVETGQVEAGLAHRDRIAAAARLAASLDLEVHAGHGLDFNTVVAIAAMPLLTELNIGHSLVGEALFSGLEAAVVRMRAIMDAAR